jgi:hypothetical protein
VNIDSGDGADVAGELGLAMDDLADYAQRDLELLLDGANAPEPLVRRHDLAAAAELGGAARRQHLTAIPGRQARGREDLAHPLARQPELLPNVLERRAPRVHRMHPPRPVRFLSGARPLLCPPLAPGRALLALVVWRPASRAPGLQVSAAEQLRDARGRHAEALAYLGQGRAVTIELVHRPHSSVAVRTSHSDSLVATSRHSAWPRIILPAESSDR